MTGFVRVEQEGIELDRISSFVVIGDPGCDGLGAETMSLFARALKAAKPDFGIVAGDLVPFGSVDLYRNVRDFVDTVADYPVYALPGNHDTDHYEEFFGRKDYWIAGSGILLIVLDDSRRFFSDSTLEFLKRTLRDREEEKVILLFHIPPPNGVSGNCVEDASWGRMMSILRTQVDRIRFIVSGHLHSYFQDVSSGIPLIVTGGGGARIEWIGETVDPSLAYHHVVEFRRTDDGDPVPRHIPTSDIPYLEAENDENLAEYLATGIEGETAARARYELSAEETALVGYPGVAKVFRAAADAEGIHARNHLRVLEGWTSAVGRLDEALANERKEIEKMYRDYLTYAESRGKGLARYTFHDAREAEKIHESMFAEALAALKAGKDIPVRSYWTCTSCGQTFRGDDPPRRCPVCGAPHDKIREVA